MKLYSRKGVVIVRLEEIVKLLNGEILTCEDKVMEIDVFIPSYKEQMEIGKYFRDLDTLITLHQR